jgi:hypothetical protein
VQINTGGSESEHIAARAAVTDFPAVRAGARGHHGVFGMTSKDWIEHMITARLAEHDERERARRAGNAATARRWHVVVLARERAAEERARLRKTRNKPLWRKNEGRAAMPAQRARQGRALSKPWRLEHRS